MAALTEQQLGATEPIKKNSFAGMLCQFVSFIRIYFRNGNSRLIRAREFPSKFFFGTIMANRNTGLT